MLLKNGTTQCMFVSVHAPHRAVEMHQLVAWWEETRKLCRELIHCGMVVFGADCNACLGSQVSEHVGECGQEVQDVPGEQLHLLLEDLGLWLPSTFEDVHSGQTWSYMHKRGGATTRPDFLALPLAWRAGTISSWVDPDIHAGQACLDHLAVLCDVHVQIAAFEGQGPRPRAKLDETAIMDPKNRQVVEDIVMSAPQIPWSTSAHAHAALLAKHLQQGLGRAFPLQAGKRAHHFFVDLRLRLAKAHRACSRLRTQVRNQILIITLRAWKDGTGAVPVFGFLCSPWARAARFAGARQSALVGDWLSSCVLPAMPIGQGIWKDWLMKLTRRQEGLPTAVCTGFLGTNARNLLRWTCCLLCCKGMARFVVMPMRSGCDGESISLIWKRVPVCPPSSFCSLLLGPNLGVCLAILLCCLMWLSCSKPFAVHRSARRLGRTPFPRGG